MAETDLLSSSRPPNLTRSASIESESMFSNTTADASSNSLSNSSTPPTSAADSASISSASLKLDAVTNTEPETADEAEQTSLSSNKTRRSRSSNVSTCNTKIIQGTARRGSKKSRKAPAGSEERDAETRTRRRDISGDTFVGNLSEANASTDSIGKGASRAVADGIEALNLQWTVKGLSKPRSRNRLVSSESPKGKKKSSNAVDLKRRRSTRSSGEQVESLTKKLSVLGKRGRNAFEAGLGKAKRELRKLADTPEFAKIETEPVIHEVWANGKLMTGDEPPKKKSKKEAETAKLDKTEEKVEEKIEEAPKFKKRREKVWLNKGLYAGQEGKQLDFFFGTSEKERASSNLPEYNPNGLLPLPMWKGQRLLHLGRDFKLPFDVCSPLPPGQPKPDEWRKVPKNRFVGDAAAAWKKSTVFDDFSSRCICSPASGCGDDCQNRIMLYECDDGNCSLGREQCTNRAFQDLKDRRSKGGKYRIGVEVIKTADRGYGVRANRCFDANQIIVEYTGEIITEDECDRRMNEVYKNNECYYLMLFDQNMIIDATRGSIARFVNHSCEPNSRMVKWIVAGKPRMALFAGDRPIMTGEELTYDYNFDPFSAKNVQECRCGAENCRGVLGPKPKDKPKPVTESIKQAVKSGKRKLKEFMAGEKETKSPKKRKIASLKRSSGAKEAAKSLKRSLSKTISSATKRGKAVVVKKSTKSRVLKTYGTGKGKKTVVSSRNSSLTLVNGSPGKGKGKGKVLSRKVLKDTTRKVSSGRVRKPSTKAGGSITKNIVRSVRKRTMTSKAQESSKDVQRKESTIRVISIVGEEKN